MVDKLASVDILRNEHLGPEIKLTALHKVTRLLLEHRVIIRDSNEFVITEALRIGNVRQVWITLLAVFANYQWLVKLKHER